jgi:hypothetical protein
MELGSSNRQSIRRLTALQETGSTARVLNLLAIRRRFKALPEMAEAPLFQCKLLNQSIIVKHRLRADELGHFFAPRSTATKIMVPIDPSDLKNGARYLFVGQNDFEAVAHSMFGEALRPEARDRVVLDLIDQLPSLDPFLLREKLRGIGVEPARPYFAVSDADTQKMFEFVRREVSSLVEMAGEDGGRASTDRFVRTLLSTSSDSKFAPLRDVLGLSDREYEEGIFAWRGFLYYKWAMADILRPISDVAREILAAQAQGYRSAEVAAYLREAKLRIISALNSVTKDVRANLAIYDRAYADLTGSRPAAFREFLLAAPELFSRLGLALGAVQHIASYWRYRFAQGAPQAVSGPELMDLFLDFEASLAISKSSAIGGAARGPRPIAFVDSGEAA